MVRAGAFPDGLALVAVKGRPSVLTSSVAIIWLEMRTPTPPVEFTSGAGISWRAGRTIVKGPGQKRAINFSARGEISVTKAFSILRSAKIGRASCRERV